MISVRLVLVTICLSLFSIGVIAKQTKHSAAYESMDKKIEVLQANAQRPPQQPQNTDLTQEELNAYFAEGGVDIPKGLEGVKFDLKPAVVHATARVNFDTLAQGKAAENPLFSLLFTGIHDVEAQAQASGAQGQGTIIIDWMKVDGVQVPRAALEYLVQHYVKPKYPEAGMTTKFPLPVKIDMAVVSQGKVTLTQK